MAEYLPPHCGRSSWGNRTARSITTYQERRRSTTTTGTSKVCSSAVTMPIRKAAPPDPARQLMIKTKACQRLVKEVNYYHKEVKENEAKLSEMKAENRDPYDIKKFEEVLGESYMMIPDSTTRLKQALEDLASYVDSSEVAEVKSCEWYPQAKAVLESERERYENNDDIVNETDLDNLKDGEAF